MLRFFGLAALAATLSLVPAAGLNSATNSVAVRAAVASPAAILPAAAMTVEAQLGMDADGHDHESGLAPKQTADDFETWLNRSPTNRAQAMAFRDFLAAEGVVSVVPIWQLTRTSSSWKECGAQPFEIPPQALWDRIITTLKFVRDDVVPSVGQVEPLSAYRNAGLNACSNGAPKSAHREFFAIDLTPVNKALDRTAMIRSVCAAHARDGREYNTGLGFYTGRRFHVDSSGFRKWGANGKGATSPCVTQA
jgi:hypothetical protein